MPYKSEKIKISKTKFDRRIKLTNEQKKEIRQRRDSASQRELASEYGVSRRLIVWTLYPDRLEHNKRLRQLRGGSKFYYDKKYNTKAIRNTRNYKQKLFIEGKISLNRSTRSTTVHAT